MVRQPTIFGLLVASLVPAVSVAEGAPQASPLPPAALPGPPAPAPAPEAEPRWRWYGYEILIVDLAGWAMLGASDLPYVESRVPFADRYDTPLLPWMGGFLLLAGGPLVHWAHGDVAHSSAGVPLTLVLALGMFGGAFMKDLDSWTVGDIFVGTYVAGQLLDVGFSWEKKKPKAKTPERDPYLAPLVGVAPTRGGGLVTVGGFF